MEGLVLPKTYNIGGIELVELSHLESMFGISRSLALLYLKALHIQPMYIKDGTFFSISTFNRILFVLSKPGSPGFLFPGSKAKQNKNLRKKGYITEVTDDMVAEALSPRIMAEMQAATGNAPDMVKKLLANENAKTRKKKSDPE